MAGVLKEGPVPKGAPPVGFANQLMVAPDVAVALSVKETGPGPHANAGVVLTIKGAFTFIMGVEAVEVCPALSVTVTV